MAVKLKGIDVSHYQGNINWVKVKGNVDFAILRAGYGDAISYPKQVDSTFERNYKGCKDNNIPCGVYWYSYARSVAEAKQEAKACLSVIKGKTFEYPIYFDLEEKSQFAKGKAFCESIVKAFCNTLEEAGYYAGLYFRHIFQIVLLNGILFGLLNITQNVIMVEITEFGSIRQRVKSTVSVVMLIWIIATLTIQPS